MRKELPPEKQFLITRKVPCQKRLKEVMASGEACGEVDVGGGWTDIDNPDSESKTGNGG